ncbi:MAG TPA: amidohydrolase family protein [Candidatus Limnocylindria bacterium]|nr:amidohydrolase family protein [Candidatus Limnocylindria bacterium]
MTETLFAGGHVPSVRDGTLRMARADVLVEDGRVAWVGAPGARTSRTTVDVSGRSLVPGLIDLHTHPGVMEGFRNDADRVTPDRIRRDLRIFAAYGVTTVQSLGLDRDFAFDVARDRRPDEARLLTVGHGFGVEGVPFFTMDPPGPLRTQDTAEIARVLADAKARGASGVKIWYDDWYGQHAKMAEHVARAIIAESARLGLRSFAHLYRVDDAKALVRAGLRTVAHMPRDREADGELWELMKERDVPVVPTLTVPYSNVVYLERAPELDDPLFLRHLPPGAREHVTSPEYAAAVRARKEFPAYAADLANAKANVRAAHRAGVRIAFGTDAGVSQRTVGWSAHHEMELLQECGMSAGAVLRSATVEAAAVLGRDDLGDVAVGKRADLVVVRGDATGDVRALRPIEAVYIDGERACGALA